MKYKKKTREKFSTLKHSTTLQLVWITESLYSLKFNIFKDKYLGYRLVGINNLIQVFHSYEI